MSGTTDPESEVRETRRTVFRVLIPPAPRRFTGQRWVKTVARSIHVGLAGVYLGALVFHVDAAARTPWFLGTVFSGLLMLCLDLYESGAFLLQVRGLVVAGKLIVLALLPWSGAGAVWVIAAVTLLSVISSHATASFRYFLIWGRGRIDAAETKG